MKLAKHATTGFTIMELLVVLAIAAIVAAIMLPVTQVLIEQNNVMLCSSNLQRLGVAMKAYHLDWQGVPPVLLPVTGATPWEDARDLPQAPEGFPAVLSPHGYLEPNPLMALYRGGYLRDRRSLRCPRDMVTADPTDWRYYMSYAWRQPDITPAEEVVKITDAGSGEEIRLNLYKYNPARIPIYAGAPPWGVGPAPASYQQRRMLSPGFVAYLFVLDVDPDGPGPAPPEPRQYWVTHTDPLWWPDDTTVVTWCDAHADIYQRGGSGIYQVLFWDGSVMMKPRELFEVGGLPEPAAAWEVLPGD